MTMGYSIWNGISTTKKYLHHTYITSLYHFMQLHIIYLLHRLITRGLHTVIPFACVLLIYATLQHRSGEGVRLGMTCGHILCMPQESQELSTPTSPMRSTMVCLSPSLPLLTLFHITYLALIYIILVCDH